MKNIYLLSLIVVLFCCAVAEKKLIFIQEMFRHGARYPLYPSAGDKTEYADELKSIG